ncbi:MAG: saccharopine dehydrogenase NADP-binding domain-containing protein [Anaerolineales bacterium]|nr:saccharopine dehydrogenase NADP-binding domain-containing protein [Anaerolineales bacterium]
MAEKFDIVIWGATGFTGRLVAEYLTRQYGVDGQTVRWTIAGRNPKKLDSIRLALAHINPAAANLPLLVADSQDRASLDNLVQQTKVVCSTVGPYALYGTPLVAACAEQGVDYCDLTGEVPWIRQNIDSFHEQAVQTGARIVHCCGFDSIPSDLGTLMMQEYARDKYGRFCPEIKFVLAGMRGGFSGGTAASLLNMIEGAGNERAMRRILADPFALVPDGNPTNTRVTDQMNARWDADLERWTAPFIMASINTRIVRRSNYLLGYRYGRSFQYSEATQFPRGFVGGRLAATGFSLGLGTFMGLAGFGPTRKLLEKSVLPAPGEGPDQETRDNGYFRIKLLGKLPAHDGQPAISFKGEVAGNKDPGYGETAKMVAESALCLALDDKIPQRGGILTPAASMGMHLIERLRAAGMTFAVPL